MKLYIYEHCPFCTRARMIFGLKQLPVELAVIMEGDAETPTRLIGKKAVPILQKEDGTHMGESLDIVAYIDAIGEPVLKGQESAEIEQWTADAWKPALKLFIPRFTRGEFAELATPEAREAYRLREEKAFGDLEALLGQSKELMADINEKLLVLESLLAKKDASTSLSDIKLWPVLRCLSIVKGLQFPEDVRGYMEDYALAAAVPLLFDQAQ